MYRIKTVKINNFKFFAGEFKLDIDRKNILVFGENGSGKSSIYWALFTFMQSVFKADEEVYKYFSHTHAENLVNKFASLTDDSSISIEYEDSLKTLITKSISASIVNTKTDAFIRESSNSSEFINYRLLSRIYDFDNSQTIDLFKLFERELLLFIQFNKELEAGINDALSWWLYIKQGLSKRIKMTDAVYTKFQSNVTDFNSELSKYLNKIIETANEYLSNKFNQPLKIKIVYSNSTFNDFEVGSKTKRNHLTIPPKLVLSVEYSHKGLQGNACEISRPHAFLNEARLTTIALSLRFAILDERYNSNANKLLILDDLLISLDMSNRDLVLDIIVNGFSDYQKIILTHDKLLFEMAKHKINKANRDEWDYIEMYESETDNIPKPVVIRSESYIEKARKYYVLKEYDVSGNFLRKQAESFCKFFLPKRKQFSGDYSLLDLNGLILQCIDFAETNGIDVSLFQQLDSHRKFVLNPASHDSFDIPKFGSEIISCIKTLESLDQIKYFDGLKSGDQLEFELITQNEADVYKFEILVKENTSIIQMPNGEQILLSGLISYVIYKNSVKTKEGPTVEYESVNKMYTKCFAKSNKTMPESFWDGVMIKRSGLSLKSVKPS